MSIVILKLVLITPWLIWLSVKDCKRHELPNYLTMGGLAVFTVLALSVGVDYLLSSLLTGFLASLFLLLPFFLRAAGAGDVKMLFVAGVVSGPGNVLNLILLVSIAGLILAVVMIFLRKVNTARLIHWLRTLFDFRYDRSEGKKNIPPVDTEACRVPFGVAIAAGLWVNLIIQAIYSL